MSIYSTNNSQYYIPLHNNNINNNNSFIYAYMVTIYDIVGCTSEIRFVIVQLSRSLTKYVQYNVNIHRIVLWWSLKASRRKIVFY